MSNDNMRTVLKAYFEASVYYVESVFKITFCNVSSSEVLQANRTDQKL